MSLHNGIMVPRLAPKLENAIRAGPAQDPNWGKGPPSEPEMAPAQEKQPGFMVGPISPSKPKGNFCLG
ncbi:hypothetical protein GBA52_020917 [Prunus armeniaca]|nr:hypothetical protein GBA52_020917 [Prunus armeniaca]